MSVYFARVKGYVKIGYSADPIERIGTITTGSCEKPDDVIYGDPIHALGWVPGDRKTEKAIHHRFGHLHVLGEWFWDDDSYEAFIEADEFGLPYAGATMDLVILMRDYPHVPRSKVLKVLAAERAKASADPESTLSQVRAITGVTDEWVAEQSQRIADEQAADRAYWRSQRESAA